MIKLIGIKRLFLLSLLIMILAILGAFYSLWMEPARQEAEGQLNRLDREIRTLRNDILNVKEEIETTERNTPYFEQLEELGFFQRQDRFQAERLIQDIRAQSGVQSANFSIEPLVDIDDNRAARAGHRLIMSHVRISNINAYTDLEIYRFLYLINNRFPGHTRLSRFQLERSGDITPSSLAQLSEDADTAGFVRGSAEFQWLTMLEEDGSNEP